MATTFQAPLFTPVATAGRIPDALTVADFPGLSKRDRDTLTRREWNAPRQHNPLPQLLADMRAGQIAPDFERVAVSSIGIPRTQQPSPALRAFLHNRGADVLSAIDGRRLVGATDIGPLIRDRDGRLWAWGDPLTVFVLQGFGAGIETVAPVFAWAGVGE